MNENFFKSDKYYLQDVIDGEIKKNRIFFSVVDKSKYNLNNAKEVKIENRIKEYDENTGEEYFTTNHYEAFIKSSVESYREDLDIINSEIAFLLGVSASKVFRLENEEKMKGIVNLGIKEEEQQQIGVDFLVDRLVKFINDGTIKMTNWLNNYFSLPKTSSMDVIHSEEEIAIVIEMGINIITDLLKLNKKEEEKLKYDYFKMIFFDLLTNNTYRAFNNYSVLVDNNAKFVRLAPVYDYNNELKESNYYLINNVYVEKNAILSLLYRKYYLYIKEISRGISENFSLYLDSINLIIENNTSSNIAKQIKHNMKSNMDTIKMLEKVNSKNLSENKLDVAMTHTSINLNALNKNQIIQNKYILKKKSEPIKVVKRDEVKVIVEPQKKKASIGKNVFLIILGLLLLIGIGVGFAYIIINYIL